MGATHHRYSIDVVGDTLLRQQALLTINNLPSIIARLKDDTGELTQARSGMAGMAGMAPSRKKGTPPSVPPNVPPLRVGSAAAAGRDDALDNFDDALDDFDRPPLQLILLSLRTTTIKNFTRIRRRKQSLVSLTTTKAEEF